MHLEGLRDKLNLNCMKRVAKRRIPILRWLPNYRKSFLIGDIIAGITVGLTTIPQAMAYAVLAGLRPEFGLYSSFIAPMVYMVLGSCRQVAAGPESLISLLSFQTCGPDFPECVILAGFYSGVLELLFGILRLGPIVSLISEPVAIGFTAGAAVTTSSSQVKSILGLNGPKGTEFWSYWESIIVDTWAINAGDAILGISCALILILIQNLNWIIKPDRRGTLSKIIWGIGVSRNVLVVVTSTLIAYLWTEAPFQLTGYVKSGIPEIRPPLFLLPKGNSTSETFTFFETWDDLSTGPLFIALISILNNVAISKAFARGETVDGTQEMLALGVANILGSFFRAQPTSGSFSRSAVNNASGVNTPLGGLVTGIMVLLALTFLTPACQYIPKASLSAVIICAVLPMVKLRAIAVMWKISKLDLTTCFVTFFACTLLGVEAGIGIGVFVSVVVLLRESLSDALISESKFVEGVELNYVLLKPKHGFNFAGVDTIRKCVSRSGTANGSIKGSLFIVVNCVRCTTMDYSAAVAIVELGRSVRKLGQTLVLLNIEEKLRIRLDSAVNLSNHVILLSSDDADLDLELQLSHLKLSKFEGHSYILNMPERLARPSIV